MKAINWRLKKKLNEVFFIEPNDLACPFLTNIYKVLTARFKTAPFIVVIPLSFIFTFIFYLIFGKLIVKVVSLLQYGF
ncbi:MAG: hypothetical protein ACK4FL_03355 [Microgenomates group bacterium]